VQKSAASQLSGSQPRICHIISGHRDGSFAAAICAPSKYKQNMRPLISAFSLLLLVACGNPCGNTIKGAATSPDGKYVATAFIRNCGATTSFSPQVYLGPAGGAVSDVGNIFIGNHTDQIQVKWLSPTNLVIYCDCSVDVLISKYYGIVIESQKLSSE
jgi:hypothetical protein